MLVEINLLPKKEPKSITFLVMVSSALFILLVAGLFIFWQGTRLEDELASLNKQITTTQKLVQREQAKLENNVGSDSVAQLEGAVKWASDEPIKSAPVLKRVVALLPDRGFIQNISYAESGELSMTVQFDSSREAAYFYKTLQDQNWISAASLSSLVADELDQNANSTENATETNEKVLPRYTGQFLVTLNRDVINSEELVVETENQIGGDGL